MAGSILHHCAHCGAPFNRPRPDANSINHCSVACRFWGKVDKSAGPGSCWPWMAARSSKGYGLFKGASKAWQAHRYALVLTLDKEIPRELLACHKCDNPACCNPDHLFLGTAKENTQDMIAKGREWDMSKSPEFVEKLRAAKRGKPRSPEVRAKLREASLRQSAAISARQLGRKFSEETKQKLRDAWVRRKALSLASAV